MKYWKISYYKTRNWIDAKYIKDEYAQGAINKARVKNIVDVEEISEEEYKAGRNAAVVVTSPWKKMKGWRERG